jgi:hypothetical protein
MSRASAGVSVSPRWRQRFAEGGGDHTANVLPAALVEQNWVAALCEDHGIGESVHGRWGVGNDALNVVRG